MTGVTFSLKNEPIKKSFIYLLAEFFNYYYSDESIFILDLSNKTNVFRGNHINNIFTSLKVVNFSFKHSQELIGSKIDFSDSRAYCLYNLDKQIYIEDNIDEVMQSINYILDIVIKNKVERIFMIIPEDSVYRAKLSKLCLNTYNLKIKDENKVYEDHCEEPIALLDKSIINAIKSKKISLPRHNKAVFQSKWLVSVLQLANKVQRNEPFLELFLDAMNYKAK